MARNSPVIICNIRQIPSNDPKFHHPLIVDGVGRSTRTYGSNSKTEPLDTFAWFVQRCRYSILWTPDDEQNGRSKHVELHKNCRINIYRKCILLVCLYNLLRFTVHKMSNFSGVFLSEKDSSNSLIKGTATCLELSENLGDDASLYWLV